MREIKIVDMTLRESETQPGADLSFREKLEVAKQLERLRVDVIETGYVGESQADAVTVRTLANTIKNSVLSCPVGLDQAAVDRTWAALAQACRPRLNLIVPTSTVQMEYTYQLKADKMLKKTAELVAYCSSLTGDVEFTAEDATRSEREFLVEMIRTAIKQGAKTVTLVDAAGQMLPNEAAEFITGLRGQLPELDSVTLSLHLKDNLNLAVADALMAIGVGVDQLKTTFNGMGAPHGNLSLEHLVHALLIRHDTLGITFGLNTTEIQRSCKQIGQLFDLRQNGHSVFGRVVGPVEQPADTGEEAAMDAEADLLTVRRKVLALGYDLPETDIEAVYAQFQRLASKKKVYDRDIEALIADTARQVAPTYKMINYVINSGNAIIATAYIKVDNSGKPEESVSMGDGPIDAAFMACEQILGHHFELEDFQIQAVTQGREAMGDALVKLRHNGKLYSGRGLSTDIIGASIRAFLNAVNKIVYEEKNAI